MPYGKAEVEVWLVNIGNGSLDLTADNIGLAAAALALIETVPGDSALPPGYLTPNFRLDEMTYSDTANAQGIDNTPDARQTENLQTLCDVLELIRSACGDNPVIVSSGYRCPELNAAVGGVSNSAHLYGLAADITVPAFGTPAEVVEAIKPYLTDWCVDQLIDEGSGSARWVHVGLCDPPEAARCECFRL